MNLHMHARGCEKMKIEIKEEDWEQLDSNPAIEFLHNKTNLSKEDLEHL